MKKAENVYITHVLFPWETFAAQSEREARERASGGDRWTEDFLREVRENVLRYANEPFFPPDEFKHAEFMNTSMRNSCLNDVYRLVPLHFREEVFAGVSFPIWNQGGAGMNIFDRITASPQALADFLQAISAINTPWDDAFHRIYCDHCAAENCDNCPNEALRGSALWYLTLPAEAAE